MHSTKIFMAAALTAMLASCGQSPEETIASSCLQFELEDGTDKSKAKEKCSCLSEGLKKSMSEKSLEQIAAAFDNAKNGDDLERTLKEEGVTDGQMMSFAGVGKSCAVGGA